MDEQTQQKLDTLMNVRKDLKSAMESKGFSISNSLPFTNYPDVIEEWGKAQQEWNKYIDGSISEFTAKGITRIGAYAFYRCTNLVSVDLTGIIEIGDYAFNECGDSFRKVWIPSTCTRIDGSWSSSGPKSQAFCECRSLTIYTDCISKPSGWANLVKYYHWGSAHFHEPRWGSTYEEFLNA